MRTIKVWADTGLVGSDRETVIEVDDDCSDEEIEELAREAMFEMIEWGWAEVARPASGADPRGEG